MFITDEVRAGVSAAAVPDGDQATLVGLTGVHRTPVKTPPYRLTVSRVAAVTIRTLISRIAVEISASEVPPCGESAASISPDRLACPSPCHGLGVLLPDRAVP